MASSEVEVASSSSPFGCVLKDRNRRDNGGNAANANARTVFQRNLKELVKDHFHNCIQGNENTNLGRNSRFNHGRNNNENHNINDEPSSSSSSSSAINISTRQSKIIDRWAARQAKEMVSTIEKQSQEPAELLAKTTSKRENNNNSPDKSIEASPYNDGNLGASSLVQIWEARLSQSFNSNTTLSISTLSRTSSGLNERESFSSYCNEGPSRSSEMEESYTDWESQSERTARNSDAGDSERVRVADIIKRLTSACGDDYNENEMWYSPCADPGEQREQQRGFAQIVSTPKIRGRQAFADLLMQLERDRHRELNSLVERQSVSRFSQRGRLQAMLRLRFMQRGMANQDKQRESGGSPVLDHLPKRSAIRQLREKFSTGIDRVTVQSDATTSRNHQKEMANNTVRLDNSSATKSNHQEVSTATVQSISTPKVLQTSEDHHCKQSSPRTAETQQETNAETTCLGSQETAETSTSLNSSDRSEIAEDREANHRQKQHIDLNSREISEATTSLDDQNENEMVEDREADHHQQHIYLNQQEISETVVSLDGRDENEIVDEREANDHQQHSYLNTQEISETVASVDGQDENEMVEDREADHNQQHIYLNSQEISETIASSNEMADEEAVDHQQYNFFESQETGHWDDNELTEEEAYHQYHYVGTSYDWIREISRPRSYWEGRRQAWYEEMLSSEKEEIRQLIERKTVSRYLSTDFRKTMDQLMASRVQTQADLYQEEEPDELSQERIGEILFSNLQRNMHPEEQEQEAEQGYQVEQVDEVVEEEVEAEPSPKSQYSSQLPSPSTIGSSWSFRYNDDSSDQVAFSPSPQPSPSQAYYQESQQSSDSTKPLSIEMQLIYELRRQMEQLQCEMSELRKSVQGSADMQVKLQNSKQQEVFDGVPKRRMCRICYEMPVDSLLYRCGHMCTCLKCAHELQWSSGKCPMCRSPIDDVVRAYMES